MPLFKINFALLFSIVFIFKLQAEEPITQLGQSPPFEINIGDTSSSILVKLDSVILNETSEKIAIVEDTTTPPPCDIIFFQSGRMEYCKIISTNHTTVSYKTCDRPDGLTIVVNKSTIHKLKYSASGKEEIINEKKKGKPHKSTNGLAILSLILGIAGLALVFLFGFILIGLALTGIIVGVAALIEIRKSRKRDDQEKGANIAFWGILLNALVLVLVTLLLIS